MSSELTVGQLERQLSQKIQALYKEKLGHQPTKITCQIFDEKVAIVIENSITPAENLLVETGDNQLAEKVRTNLGEAIDPFIRETIETVLSVSVEDLLSDATIETGRTAILAVLAKTPAAKNIETVAKSKKKLAKATR